MASSRITKGGEEKKIVERKERGKKKRKTKEKCRKCESLSLCCATCSKPRKLSEQRVGKRYLPGLWSACLLQDTRRSRRGSRGRINRIKFRDTFARGVAARSARRRTCWPISDTSVGRSRGSNARTVANGTENRPTPTGISERITRVAGYKRTNSIKLVARVHPKKKKK